MALFKKVTYKKLNCYVSIFLIGSVTLMLSGCSFKSAISKKDSSDYDQTYDLSDSQTEESSDPGYVTYDNNYEKSKKSGYNYLCISDRYGMSNNISLNEFRNQDDCIEKLYSFHELISKKLDYLEFYEQSAQKIGYYEGALNFVLEENEEYLNQVVTSENGKKEYVTTLNTIEIGKTLNEQLKDVILEGRCFNDDDFNYQNNNAIPVILGADYKESYKIGDTLSLYYIADTFNFKVVGFFPADYTLKHNIAIYSLNNFICIPFFDIEAISSCGLDKDFLFSYYLEKNNCYVAYDAKNSDDKKAKEEVINDIIKRTNICYGIDEAIYSQFEFSD
ncbi:hypothetical protein [Anaerosacchariphilus polymeriproducens]|uniref:Lipoprotein n=1 Tax=Anaerosacchariphilus polymeriproducens TaxID=1812858 RepID=A0A371AS03_9FIRM|nr:hypothetical protein [Anaerosacchariphilus polymeriproducens]RDU22339.1 hypothetical protein DWV06_13660 [Anaerosacchariphilus polymeriproducens]